MSATALEMQTKCVFTCYIALDKKWYFAGCISPGSAKTNVGWGRKL